MSEEPKSGIRFDGTINWPLVITVGGVLVGAIAFGNKVVGQVDTITELVGELKKESKGLREDFTKIRLDIASQSGLSQQVQDHEQRIRGLEKR